MKFKIVVKLLSECSIGSASSNNTLIDSDILFDEFGIPYIPVRRFKGCLRDSAKEIDSMLKTLINENVKISRMNINSLFGETGKQEATLQFSNGYLKDYDANYPWLKFLYSEFTGILSIEETLSQFCVNRTFIEINEKGITKDKSLRIARVLKNGLEFVFDLNCFEIDQVNLNLLDIVVSNLRYIGSSRTRGFGYIECRLLDENNKPIKNEILEVLSNA
jgi:CRISPR/Cas system CSM-associated protein Csm3 (group 7 of RAMP superfamily)